MEGKKKIILLSFKPDYFRPILYGIKKYEYRKRFCMEAVTVYLYLSSPLQEIIGKMECGIPIQTKDIAEKYPKGAAVHIRAQRCVEEGELYAIPIKSLQLYKKPIPLEQLKSLIPVFHVPRSYLDITKFKTIYDYLCDQEMYEIEFYHSHDILYEDNFGITCEEIESSSVFKSMDSIYTSDPRYGMIHSGYLNKKNLGGNNADI